MTATAATAATMYSFFFSALLLPPVDNSGWLGAEGVSDGTELTLVNLILLRQITLFA
jgi:hypothetical protein